MNYLKLTFSNIIKTNSVGCNQIKPITQQLKTVLKILLIHCME